MGTRYGHIFSPLEQRVDGAALAAFRIGFGVLMFCATVRFWLKGWIEEIYLTPNFHFFFTWSPVSSVPSEFFIYLLFGLIACSALGIAFGFFTRVCACIFFLCFTYVELLEKSAYLNHYYLVSILSFLLIWMPSDHVWSLSRKQQDPWVPMASYVLLRTQVGLVYVFAGLAKLNADWLVRGEPLATWLGSMGHIPYFGGVLAQSETALLMSWAGAIFDLTICFFLMHRKTQWWAYLIAVFFHLTIWLLFPIGIFSWLMLLCATIFLPCDWPRTVTRLRPASSPAESQKVSRIFFALGFIWLSIQVLVPLRHYAMPGPVNWNEQGFRFSWRVMLVEKTGTVEYRVYNRDTGAIHHVHPRKSLTPQQYRMLCTQPDMIVDYARHLESMFESDQQHQIEVHADAFVSFNGRPLQRYLSGHVNLADPEIELGETIEPLKTTHTIP